MSNAIFFTVYTSLYLIHARRQSHLWTIKKYTNVRLTPKFQWKAHNHVLIHPHLPIWHPFIKADQLDPLIKNQMQTNALSTVFTHY